MFHRLSGVASFLLHPRGDADKTAFGHVCVISMCVLYACRLAIGELGDAGLSRFKGIKDEISFKKISGGA